MEKAKYITKIYLNKYHANERFENMNFQRLYENIIPNIDILHLQILTIRENIHMCITVTSKLR